MREKYFIHLFGSCAANTYPCWVQNMVSGSGNKTDTMGGYRVVGETHVNKSPSERVISNFGWC